VIVDLFGDGPVVAGPVAADLAAGAVSARAAVSAYRSTPGWPDAPRPVLAMELLAERSLAGDGHARRQLVDEVYLPLLHARGALVETLTAWLDKGSSIEGAARTLFVHPNTVRYRLRRILDVTGFAPSDPRDRWALGIGLTLGRLRDHNLPGATSL
jgi:DNA-binding PucR family transcriptional regulator